MLTLEQFKNARSVLQGVLRPTPLIHSPYLSKSCGNNVYLKPENMQVTGAYKIRGAYFKISTLTEEEKSRGLVTASAGNHAQGVAYAAQAAGVAATIVMPTTTPLVKVNNTKDYGATVILHGETFDDAAAEAQRLVEEKGYTYPTVMDETGEIFAQYGISAFPTTFMIDADGNVFGYITGSLTRDIMDSIIEQTRTGVRAE